jgi:hypothetical protein
MVETNNLFNDIFNKIYFGIIIIIFIYSLFKERKEFGCSSYFSISRHCNDLNSIYLKGTFPLKNDNTDTLIKKLKSILSIHLKYAIWRKCFIIATIITFFAKGLTPDIKPQTLISLHIVSMAIIYFYHNFMNFHVYRLADNIGTLILLELKKYKTSTKKISNKKNSTKKTSNKKKSTKKTSNKKKSTKKTSNKKKSIKKKSSSTKPVTNINKLFGK